jgi:hypothetical protein
VVGEVEGGEGREVKRGGVLDFSQPWLPVSTWRPVLRGLYDLAVTSGRACDMSRLALYTCSEKQKRPEEILDPISGSRTKL